jgi:hypothetical protein
MTEPTPTTAATSSRRAFLVAAGSAALLAACGGGGSKKAAATTTSVALTPSSEAPTSTSTTAAAPATFPLTGLPVDDAAKLARPALTVKIDNAPAARPQIGLDAADLVFEEVVEGGIVRFCAVFHSKDAPALGPVRSVRAEDATLVTPLKGYYAYSGGSDPFKAIIRTAPVTLVGFDELPGAYHRRSDRPSPDNLYTSTPDLYGKAPKLSGQQPPALFTYRAAGSPLPGGAAAAHLAIRMGTLTDTAWNLDAASGRWLRVTNGTPHNLEKGGQLSFPNVVVQLVGYRNTSVVDKSGTVSPEALLVGEGDCVVLSGPSVVRGRWKRAAAGTVTQFLDASGAPIPLLPGPTWVMFPATGTPVAVS